MHLCHGFDDRVPPLMWSEMERGSDNALSRQQATAAAAQAMEGRKQWEAW